MAKDKVTIIKNDKGEVEVIKKKSPIKKIMPYGKNKKEFNKIKKKLKK